MSLTVDTSSDYVGLRLQATPRSSTPGAKFKVITEAELAHCRSMIRKFEAVLMGKDDRAKQAARTEKDRWQKQRSKTLSSTVRH